MSTLEARVTDVLRDVKVLIVDDEYYTRKVIRTLLLAIGCTKVYEAGDGAVGLEMIRAVSPDIILLDWEMPGIDGAEFVLHVRSSGSLPMPGVPIIMLTGHGERWRVREAVRLGVHEFLLKPVSSETLQERILSVLAKPHQMAKHRYEPGYRQPAAPEPESEHRAPPKAAVDPAA
jgi:two-component system chemotaxis response regulator CheY